MKRGRLCDWSELGQGTFGVVHVAYDENGNQMAVKKLRSMWYDYPVETVSELTCLALRHPHLAGMHGACRPSVSSSGDDSDSSAEAPRRHLWLCMPHGGRSLDAWLRAHRPSFDQVGRLMAQLLCGVEYMHSALGIYHGDIKPANVFVHRGNQLKLGDLGLSKTTLDATNPKFHTMCGSPLYLAPEVHMGEISPASNACPNPSSRADREARPVTRLLRV